jgi:hypothetical protein
MYITRVRVLSVYHWMYASHTVSSWGRCSVTTFCVAVSQTSMYVCTLWTQVTHPRTPHRDHWRGEKLGVIILDPKSPKSRRLMMGCICEGPTSATSKSGPSSLSHGQRPDTIRRATSDLGSRPGYHDEQLHLARPKVPSSAIPRQAPPPGGELQRGASWPALLGTCRSSEAGGSALSDGQVMMRFSPTWEADCPGVPSPG